MTKRIEGPGFLLLGRRETANQGPCAQAPFSAWTFVIIDVSGSMSGDKLVQAKKAVRAYAADACPFGEWVGLMSFSDLARVIAHPGPVAEVVCEAADKLAIEGGTHLTPALEIAESLGQEVRGVRKAVVVTDGMTSSPEAALAVAERMRSNGWFFVTRGIPAADEEFLTKLRGPEGVGCYTETSGLVQAMRDAARLLPARTL